MAWAFVADLEACTRGIDEVVKNHEENLPEVGRYNGGQKLLFFTIIVCLTCLLLSGIVIWRQYFSAYFAIGTIRFSALAHAFFAFLLICSIIVHIYAGIWVKGSIRAMTRGWVTPGWVWKHHRAWFREVTKDIQRRVANITRTDSYHEAAGPGAGSGRIF